MSEWDSWLNGELSQIRDADLMRELRPVAHGRDPVRVEYDDRALTLFSSNDYLGLSTHEIVARPLADAAGMHGTGLRGSPLVCGYTTIHQQLEHELSRLEGTEETLLFSTGFAANVSVLATLAGEDCEVFSDELNHASIIDGTRLAKRRGATVCVYRHRDVKHLESLLAESTAARKLVVTDGVFSMDGDLAPLLELAELKARHPFLLVVDDAHGTLVLGTRGAGTVEHLKAPHDAVDIRIGTLSKAFGCHGGFVSTSKDFKALLLNRGRPYVFSTALPVPIAAAALGVLHSSDAVSDLRTTLHRRVTQLESLTGLKSDSAIVPLVIGSEREALAAASRLLEAGFHVPAIRPPTVPPGTSRLRIAISAAHREEDIVRLASELRRLDLIT